MTDTFGSAIDEDEDTVSAPPRQCHRTRQRQTILIARGAGENARSGAGLMWRDGTSKGRGALSNAAVIRRTDRSLAQPLVGGFVVDLPSNKRGAGWISGRSGFDALDWLSHAGLAKRAHPLAHAGELLGLDTHGVSRHRWCA